MHRWFIWDLKGGGKWVLCKVNKSRDIEDGPLSHDAYVLPLGQTLGQKSGQKISSLNSSGATKQIQMQTNQAGDQEGICTEWCVYYLVTDWPIQTTIKIEFLSTFCQPKENWLSSTDLVQPWWISVPLGRMSAVSEEGKEGWNGFTWALGGHGCTIDNTGVLPPNPRINPTGGCLYIIWTNLVLQGITWPGRYEEEQKKNGVIFQ